MSNIIIFNIALPNARNVHHGLYYSRFLSNNMAIYQFRFVMFFKKRFVDKV